MHHLLCTSGSELLLPTCRILEESRYISSLTAYKRDQSVLSTSTFQTRIPILYLEILNESKRDAIAPVVIRMHSMQSHLSLFFPETLACKMGCTLRFSTARCCISRTSMLSLQTSLGGSRKQKETHHIPPPYSREVVKGATSASTCAVTALFEF